MTTFTKPAFMSYPGEIKVEVVPIGTEPTALLVGSVVVLGAPVPVLGGEIREGTKVYIEEHDGDLCLAGGRLDPASEHHGDWLDITSECTDVLWAINVGLAGMKPVHDGTVDKASTIEEAVTLLREESRAHMQRE